MNTGLLRHAVATVLTVYGIETNMFNPIATSLMFCVATVLTVYGIETRKDGGLFIVVHVLQQCLPFTVLKLSCNTFCSANFFF